MTFKAKMSSFLQAYTGTYPETWNVEIFSFLFKQEEPRRYTPAARPEAQVVGFFGLPVSKLLMVHAERFTQIQAFYGPACLPLVWPDPFPSLPLPGEPLTTGCQLLHCFSNFWKIYLGMILSAETGPHSQDSESPSLEWAQEPAFLIHSWVALEVLA